MKAAIANQTEKYKGKFRVVPDFKAGFHVGKVTTGEIGEIKKGIIFIGDTLNATSRIQGLCNTYNVDILISGDLVAKLNLNSGYTIKSMGENERRKEEKIELFTISSGLEYTNISVCLVSIQIIWVCLR
jgi:adenylate cyclase